MGRKNSHFPKHYIDILDMLQAKTWMVTYDTLKTMVEDRMLDQLPLLPMATRLTLTRDIRAFKMQRNSECLAELDIAPKHAKHQKKIGLHSSSLSRPELARLGKRQFAKSVANEYGDDFEGFVDDLVLVRNLAKWAGWKGKAADQLRNASDIDQL